jgi:hypothetical protein
MNTYLILVFQGGERQVNLWETIDYQTCFSQSVPFYDYKASGVLEGGTNVARIREKERRGIKFCFLSHGGNGIPCILHTNLVELHLRAKRIVRPISLIGYCKQDVTEMRKRNPDFRVMMMGGVRRSNPVRDILCKNSHSAGSGTRGTTIPYQYMLTVKTFVKYIVTCGREFIQRT